MTTRLRENSKFLDLKRQLTLEVENFHLDGIKEVRNLATLAKQIIESKRRVRYLEHISKDGHDLICGDPSSIAFDPFKASILAARNDDIDEAFWLVFLATHFGKTRLNRWKVVADIYGALGEGPRWNWLRIQRDRTIFPQRLWKNVDAIKPVRGSAFGNHRKYESLKSQSARGTGHVISSYADIVAKAGGHRTILNNVIKRSSSEEEAFDLMFNVFREIPSFGRTATFDYLSTLSKLKLAPIMPGHPYLKDATGPLRGAKLLFFNSKSKRISPKKLGAEVARLGVVLGLRMDEFEDALCNWQKSPSKFVPFRG